MRRHSTLIPISREHHQMLLLAQLLKKDAPPYKGLPTDAKGKAMYAVDSHQKMVKVHFEKEEEKLFPLAKRLAPELTSLIADLENEHQELRLMFKAINPEKVDPEKLDGLGRLLEQHIRKEERVFFQQLQATSAEELEKLFSWN